MYFVCLREIDIKNLLLHENINEWVLLPSFPCLFDVLFNALYEMSAHCCWIVTWAAGSNEIDNLSVWHEAEQLIFVEQLELYEED